MEFSLRFWAKVKHRIKVLLSASPSYANSTLTAASATGSADGSTGNTLTLTVRDTDNALMLSKAVTFVVSSGVVSAGQSTMTGGAASIAATSGTLTLTFYARNAAGVILPNIQTARIVPSSTGTGNTLTAVDSATDKTGRYRFTFSSTVAEAKTISVTVDGTLITQTVAITVTAGAPATLYTEDWAYASTALMKAAGTGIYIENEAGTHYSGVGAGAIDLNIGGGAGGENFVRNTFPDVTTWTSDVVVVNGTADRQDNYTIRQQKNFAAGLETIAGGGFEMFVRFRYSADWTTECPWVTGIEDHKTLLLYPYPARGGDRWSIKIGSANSVNGPVVRAGDPVLGDRNSNVKVYTVDPEAWGSTYWDGAWHTMQIRVTGLGGASGQTDTLLDGVLVDRVTGRDYTDFTGLDYYNPGANRNYGQDTTMEFDTGLITVSTHP